MKERNNEQKAIRAHAVKESNKILKIYIRTVNNSNKMEGPCLAEAISGDQQIIIMKRRNLGRQARRRRKKALEIEAAAAAAITTTTTSASLSASSSFETSNTKNILITAPTSNTVVLATDRNYVWPAVKELSQLSQEEEQALAIQLGYLPGNALRIAATASKIIPKDDNDNDIDNVDNSPLVVELYPLVLRDESDGTKARRKRTQTENKGPLLMEPFPTTYWVTHARIRALISKLELDRWGQKIEERLQEDVDAMNSMKLAHEEYSKKRYELITEKDRDWITERGWDYVFGMSRGVAGIRNHASVKCLHAHAAHYWSGCLHNIVGKWVAEEVAMLLRPNKEIAEN